LVGNVAMIPNGLPIGH